LAGLLVKMVKTIVDTLCRYGECCRLDLTDIVILLLYCFGTQCSILELMLSLYMIRELLDLKFEIVPTISLTALRIVRSLSYNGQILIRDSRIELTEEGRRRAHELLSKLRKFKYVATSCFVLVEGSIFLQELERVTGTVRSVGSRRLFVTLIEDIVVRNSPQLLDLADRVLKELVRD